MSKIKESGFQYTLNQWVEELANATALQFYPVTYADKPQEAIENTRKLLRSQILELLDGSNSNNYKRLDKPVYQTITVSEAHKIYTTYGVALGEDLNAINFTISLPQKEVREAA